MKLTLLIGSFARGTGNIHSDIDVLRVGHSNNIKKPANIDCQMPISYIDYDLESFFKLYDEGSLFLYHAFFEGNLLSGDAEQWSQLKEDFKVSEDFEEPIKEYLEVLTYIEQYPDYELSSVPYLSNIFKCLKNIGIFKLASKKNYDFEKVSALKLGCGLTDNIAQILMLANSVFERSTPVSPELMSNFCNSAYEWKSQLNGQIKRLAHDL